VERGEDDHAMIKDGELAFPPDTLRRKVSNVSEDDPPRLLHLLTIEEDLYTLEALDFG